MGIETEEPILGAVLVPKPMEEPSSTAISIACDLKSHQKEK